MYLYHQLQQKNLNICFPGTACFFTFNPCIRIFIALLVINVKNCSHIANYQFNLAVIFLVYACLDGWLNSGAPTLVTRHNLIKVTNFHGTSLEHHSC